MNELKRHIIQGIVIVKYYITLVFIIVFKIKVKNIWLLSERGNEARDNAFSLYCYVKQKHPEITVKYVITKNSYDLKKISKEDRVIYRSWKHIYYYIISSQLISTHLNGTSPDFRAFTKLQKYKLVKVFGKETFLQHGITKDIIDIMMAENNPNLKTFICGAIPEYKFILEKYGYSKEVVKNTGFARFDKLIPINKQQILLMPTWRDYLYKTNEKEFLSSDYYKLYNELINDEELIKLLEEKNYDLVFYPHYEIQKFINKFEAKSNRIVIADMKKYDIQILLRESKLLITDYSSVFFDYAYMKKPIIYFHFDYQKYRKTQYSEGYFSYEKDGFGKICKNISEIIDEIKYNFNHEFIIRKKYEERSEKFFPTIDNNNCERIFNEINRKN